MRSINLRLAQRFNSSSFSSRGTTARPRSTSARVVQWLSPDRPCAPDSMKVSWRQRHGADPKPPAETATRLPRHPYRSESRVDRSLHHRQWRGHTDRRRAETGLSSPALNCARSGWTSSGRCCAATPAPRRKCREYVLGRSSVIRSFYFSLVFFLILLLLLLSARPAVAP